MHTPEGADPRIWWIRIDGYRICYILDQAVLVVLVLIIHTRDDIYPQLNRLLCGQGWTWWLKPTGMDNDSTPRVTSCLMNEARALRVDW